MPTVPFVDLAAQYDEVAGEVSPKVLAALKSGAYIGGPAVTEFERAYAEYAGVDHCVGVGNGTDALELALRGAGVAAGDEVVLPTNSFIATAEAVSRIGAEPVLVDVDPEHLLIDPVLVEKAITARTKAIIPVHLFGQTAPMGQLVDLADSHGLALVEDAAQSQGASQLGARAGGFGIASGTSFYPGKNLGAAGDAGAVLTDDGELAARVRVISAHGSDQKYVHNAVGFNSRLDAIQAIVLRAKLHRLEGWNELRRTAALQYHTLLSEVPGVQLPTSAANNVDVWHLYVIQVEDRDRVLAELTASGIGAGIHYPTPIHLTGAYGRHHRPGDFPVAEAAARRILSLPMFPHITAAQQEAVASRLTEALQGR